MNDNKHPLDQLEFSTRVGKRAQYEAFEFTLCEDGYRVRNTSYADPENHEYDVEIERRLPVRCSCPADARFDGACKHRVAIAIRQPLLDAFARHQRIGNAKPVADGGQTATAIGDDTDSTDDCPGCLGDFPCWECVKTGRRELPEERHRER